MKVITTPRAISDSSIMEPMLEAIQTAREEEIVGLLIGLVRRGDDGKFIIYSMVLPECEIEDMKELHDNLREEIYEWQNERELEEGDYLDE